MHRVERAQRVPIPKGEAEMRVSKQKMPPGGSDSDPPSMYSVRDAITAPRKQIEVPVLSTFSRDRSFAIVTVPRAPWDRD